MKTSAAVASLLVASLAAATPLQKRQDAYGAATTTAWVYQTITVDSEDAAATAAAGSASGGIGQDLNNRQGFGRGGARGQGSYAGGADVAAGGSSPPAGQWTPSPVPAYSAPPVSAAAAATTPTVPPVVVPSETSTLSATSVYTPPVEVSSWTPPATVPTTTAAAPTATAGVSTGGSYSGNSALAEFTVYDATGMPGSCGNPVTNDVPSIAVSAALFAQLGDAAVCGKSITISYTDTTGVTKTATAPVYDKCPECPIDNLDLTRALWNDLTNNAYGSRYGGATGRGTVTWSMA